MCISLIYFLHTGATVLSNSQLVSDQNESGEVLTVNRRPKLVRTSAFFLKQSHVE